MFCCVVLAVEMNEGWIMHIDVSGIRHTTGEGNVVERVTVAFVDGCETRNTGSCLQMILSLPLDD
jgi:hypothetical protein